MLLEGSVLSTKLVQNAKDLCVEALFSRWEEASKAELVALFIEKPVSLIWERIRDDAMVSELVGFC